MRSRPFRLRKIDKKKFVVLVRLGVGEQHSNEVITRHEAKVLRMANKGHFQCNGRVFMLDTKDINIKTYPIDVAPGLNLLRMKLKEDLDIHDENLRAKVDYYQVNPILPTAGVCKICRFDRSVEKCHIVPARYGGLYEPFNLLDLCPNCHTLFDRHLLHWDELQKIWPRVYEVVNKRLPDPMLDEWIDCFKRKYGVSFSSS